MRAFSILPWDVLACFAINHAAEQDVWTYQFTCISGFQDIPSARLGSCLPARDAICNSRVALEQGTSDGWSMTQLVGYNLGWANYEVCHNHPPGAAQIIQTQIAKSKFKSSSHENYFGFWNTPESYLRTFADFNWVSARCQGRFLGCKGGSGIFGFCPAGCATHPSFKGDDSNIHRAMDP